MSCPCTESNRVKAAQQLVAEFEVTHSEQLVSLRIQSENGNCLANLIPEIVEALPAILTCLAASGGNFIICLFTTGLPLILKFVTCLFGSTISQLLTQSQSIQSNNDFNKQFMCMIGKILTTLFCDDNGSPSDPTDPNQPPDIPPWKPTPDGPSNNPVNRC